MSKKILIVPFILLAVGCRDRYEGQAGAASSPSPSPYGEAAGSYASPGTMSGSAADMGGSLSATVVSVDAAGRTITVREVGAPSSSTGQRLDVSTAIASSLGGYQPGDAVLITCETTGGMGATGTTGGTAGSTAGGTAGGTASTGPASLASCTMVTMIARSTGATGR